MSKRKPRFPREALVFQCECSERKCKCSADAEKLIDNFRYALIRFWFEKADTDTTEKDCLRTLTALESFIATLEHRNAALERMAEAAMDVEPPCDYDVFSGHDREDEHREDCAACELKDALRALDGGGK